MHTSGYDSSSSTTGPALRLRGRQAARRRIMAALAVAIAATLAFALTALAAPAAQTGAAADNAAGASAGMPITHYTGMAEASAAAILDPQHFIVAEDECNTLLSYRVGEPAPVGQPLNLAEFLETTDKASDIEAAARVGDVIYWMSSHSMTKSGNAREWRQRFFATRVDTGTTPPTVMTVGKPYKALLDDIVSAPELKTLKLDKAMKIAPEEPGGFNIEGLAEWKDGGLLIGLRNPLSKKKNKALLLPLLNPAAVVQGEHAQFGQPVELQLGGRGVRSIERVGDAYMIVAGPVANDGSFALYRWSGKASDAAKLQPATLLAGFSAEAMLKLAGAPQLLLLSDDGSVNPAADCGSPAKAGQRFRAIRLTLP